MKILLPILGVIVAGYVVSTALSNAIASHNQAYAVVEVSKQQTQQVGIEWGARVEIAQIEANRDVDVSAIARDGLVWSSWAWNVGSIIRALLWILCSLFVLAAVIFVWKMLQGAR